MQIPADACRFLWILRAKSENAKIRKGKLYKEVIGYNSIETEKRKMPMVKAIIVDMEGVVRDSRNAFHHAYEYALASVGLRLNSYPAETWKLRGYQEFNSLRGFMKVLYALTKSGDDVTKVFWKKHVIEYLNGVVKDNSPSREALDMMEANYLRFLMSPRILRRIPPVRAGKIGVKLFKEDGIPVGVLTNSQKRYNDAWLEHKKMNDHFDLVMSAEEVGAPKPAPDGILAVCEKMKVKPKDAAYAGDTEADIVAAVKAGCIPVGIMSGGTDRKTLRALGATYVFDDLTDFALWRRRGGKL